MGVSGARKAIRAIINWLRFAQIALSAPAVRGSNRFIAEAGADIQLSPGSVWEIGTDVYLRRDFTAHVTGELRIGDGVFFNRGCYIAANDRVTIGAHSMFGERASVHDSDYPLDFRAGRRIETMTRSPVTIGDNVWIGANAVVLKGVTIGDGAVIAAGAIVNRDVPPDCVAAGVPARVLRSTLSTGEAD